LVGQSDQFRGALVEVRTAALTVPMRSTVLCSMWDYVPNCCRCNRGDYAGTPRHHP